MKLVLPIPPNRGNDRLHWAAEKRAKDAYYTACLARYGKPPKVTLSRATIGATLYTHQTMDEDNLMARLKFPVDFLVERGYITDDSPGVLIWERPTQEIDRRNQRVEIELTEIPEPDLAA